MANSVSRVYGVLASANASSDFLELNGVEKLNNFACGVFGDFSGTITIQAKKPSDPLANCIDIASFTSSNLQNGSLWGQWHVRAIFNAYTSGTANVVISL